LEPVEAVMTGVGRVVGLWRYPVKSMAGEELDGVFCLAVSPDGGLLASGGVDSMVRLRELPEGRELKVLKGHRDHVYALAISPDNKLLVSGGGDQAVQRDGDAGHRIPCIIIQRAGEIDRRANRHIPAIGIEP